MKKFSKKEIKISFGQTGEVYVTVPYEGELSAKDQQKILSNVSQRYDLDSKTLFINNVPISHKCGKLKI
jgi:hypothetical protein